MSASTGTIQRPMGQGSIFGAIAIGVAALFAIGAFAWGLNPTATRQSATPHVSSTYVGSGAPVTKADPHADPSSVGSRIRPATPAATSPSAAGKVTPFDIDSAHTVPYVDRFAPIEPETAFDRAHTVPYVDQLAEGR